MKAAATDLLVGTLNLFNDIADQFTGAKSITTAAGLDPSEQTTAGRTVAGLSAAGIVFGAPERAAAGLTTSQAADLAGYLGYGTKVKGASFASKGQAVFSNGKNFITQDVTMHKGAQATWKMFDRQGNRLGTYTYDLLTRLGK